MLPSMQSNKETVSINKDTKTASFIDPKTKTQEDMRVKSIEIKLIELALIPNLYTIHPVGNDKGLNINLQKIGSEFCLASPNKALNSA